MIILLTIKKFAKELFLNLAPLNKIWVGQASINISKDKELMNLAHRSGCVALLIGFESMTKNGMNHYHKSLKSIDENVNAVKQLRNNGILTMASLVFGLDNDTEEVFETGYEFLHHSKSAFFSILHCNSLPGNAHFENLKAKTGYSPMTGENSMLPK